MATAALAMVCSLSLPAVAGVTSFARVEPQGNPGTISSSAITGSANFSFNSASAVIGTASAGGAAGPGTLAGQALVLLENGDRFRGGSLTAQAQASTAEGILVKRLVCDTDVCASLADLGIDRLRLSTVVRASGTTASSANTQFNHAQSEASFNWTLNGVLLGNSIGSLSGGGGKSSNDSGQVQGAGIASQVISYDVRPGAALELVLNMTVYAQATVSGGWIDTPGSVHTDHASAVADFSHTLQWMGVSSMQAFDAGGQEVALPSGARLELLGTSGFDFWNAAEPVTSTVPEPGAWLTLLAGLGLLAWRGRQGVHLQQPGVASPMV